MNYTLLALFTMIILLGCNSQNAELDRISSRAPFIRQFGTAVDDQCSDVAVDRFENIICAGTTGSDGYVVKYDRLGNLLWKKILASAGNGNDDCRSVGVDDAGNIYCGGMTTKRIGTGQILNNGSPGSIVYERADSASDEDAYVAKLGPDGSIIWIKQFGSSANDYCANLSVSPNGNSYCGARTFGEIGIDAVSGQYEGLGATSMNPMVSKIDTHGNLLWVRQFGTLSYPSQYIHDDFCGGLTIDDEENIYCVGGTAGSIADTMGSPSGMDALLWVLDTDGYTKHVAQVGVTADTNPEVINVNSAEYCNDVAVDKDKNIYCVGTVASAYGESGGGGNDAFILKWNSSYQLEWVTQLGSSTKIPGYNNTLNQYFNGMTLAHDGSLIAIGTTDSSAAGAINGLNDVFMVKFSPTGEIVWGRQYGSAGNEQCTNAVVDLNGNIYCAGSTTGNFGADNFGLKDSLIMRFDSLGRL